MRDKSKSHRYRLPSPTARSVLESLAERRQSLEIFRSKANEQRSRVQRTADHLIAVVGSSQFFVFHLFLFALWIGMNVGVLPGVKPYDPFPFGLLTMMLTLEQSLLTIFVIMSQNRASELSDLRNEIDLQINMVAEQEISKSITMLRLIGERMQIQEIINDPEIRIMEKTLDHSKMVQQTRQDLDPSELPNILMPPGVTLK